MYRHICRIHKVLLLICPLAGTCLAGETASPYPVAGLAPYERPAGAPTIKEDLRSASWRTDALRGVSQPLPGKLGFLDHQGAWYTPFSLPGMTDPYDLREHHRRPVQTPAPR